MLYIEGRSLTLKLMISGIGLRMKITINKRTYQWCIKSKRNMYIKSCFLLNLFRSHYKNLIIVHDSYRFFLYWKQNLVQQLSTLFKSHWSIERKNNSGFIQKPRETHLVWLQAEMFRRALCLFLFCDMKIAKYLSDLRHSQH